MITLIISGTKQFYYLLIITDILSSTEKIFYTNLIY